MNVLQIACSDAEHRGNEVVVCTADGKIFTGAVKYFDENYAELIDVTFTAPDFDKTQTPAAARVFISPRHVTAAWSIKRVG